MPFINEQERFPFYPDNVLLKAEDLRNMVAAAKRTVRHHALNFLLDPEDTDGTTRSLNDNGLVLWGIDLFLEERDGTWFVGVTPGAALLPGRLGENERWTFLNVGHLSPRTRTLANDVPASGSVTLPISVSPKTEGVDKVTRAARELIEGTDEWHYVAAQIPQWEQTKAVLCIGNLDEVGNRVWIADLTVYADGRRPTIEDRRRWLFPDFKTLGAYDGTEGWPQNLRMAQSDMGRGYRGLRTAWKRLVGRVSEIYQVANNVMNSAGELRETLRVSIGSAMQFAQVEGLAKWRLRVGDGRQVQADGVRVINADHETEIDPSNYRNDPDGLKLNASNVVRASAVVKMIVDPDGVRFEWKGQNIQSVKRLVAGSYLVRFSEAISVAEEDVNLCRTYVSMGPISGVISTIVNYGVQQIDGHSVNVISSVNNELIDSGFTLEFYGPVEHGSVWRQVDDETD